MWCKKCNLETNERYCPVCGSETSEDLPVEIYWCKECAIPVIQNLTQVNKGVCPICKKTMKYMSTDLRPVFPEERLLMEILLGKRPNEYINKSVWASNNRYYIDGHSISLSNSLYQTADADAISSAIIENSDSNSYEQFNKYVNKFLLANQTRLYELKDEAYRFTVGTPVGAIVKRNSHLNNFDDLVIMDLAVSNIPLNRENALQYLVDMGFMARRNYRGIDQILAKAKLQKSKKG